MSIVSWLMIVCHLCNIWPSASCKNYYNTALRQKVYTVVQIEPYFPGGEAGYQRFLNRNLRAPAIDSNDWQAFQSHVKFKFIVGANGQIMQPVVLHDNNTVDELTPLETEVLRVTSLMPAWVPGKCDGKAVATELTRSMVICYRGED